MFKVLMVCTGNICRSPIAAGMLSHYLPVELRGKVAVSSAGTHALHGNQADTHARYAMDQMGIDISAHRARQITKEIAKTSNLILTMEAAHARRVRNLMGWRQGRVRMISEFHLRTDVHDIADPYGGLLKDFQQCILTLNPCIEGVVMWLRNQVK